MKALAHPSKSRTQQKGIALLESLIAVLIISFGVLGIIGLQAVSVSAVSDARYRIAVSELADELINQIWIDTPKTNVLPAYTSNSDALPAAWLKRVTDPSTGLPGAADYPPTITTAANNVVTLTINWKQPNGERHSQTIVTSINKNPK